MPKAIAVGIVWHGGRILIGRRPPHVPLGGYWEFPGGKVLPGETPAECVVREVREETGLTVEVLGELVRLTHDYPDFSIDLTALTCRALTADAQPLGCDEVRWVEPDELAAYTFPPANRAILEAIAHARPRP